MTAGVKLLKLLLLKYMHSLIKLPSSKSKYAGVDMTAGEPSRKIAKHTTLVPLYSCLAGKVSVFNGAEPGSGV